LQTFASDAEAWECLEEHRVPSGPVLSPQDTIDHAYYRGRGAIRTVHDPVVGKLELPGFPLRFSEQLEYAPGAAPDLGEHNAEILGSVLGYDHTRIAQLTDQGVLLSKND
jgi:crotonobetainyl-CoA:carnitine CoA-transferase CaiB-like acyl-CoA transferase